MFLTWLGWSLAGALAFLLLVLGKVAMNLATKEVEGRLEQLPFTILKFARWRLPAELRQPMHDDWWLPDLQERLEREGSRPITRLIKGTWFATSLVAGAGRAAHAAGVPSLRQRLLRPSAPTLSARTKFRRFLFSLVVSGASGFGIAIIVSMSGNGLFRPWILLGSFVSLAVVVGLPTVRRLLSGIREPRKTQSSEVGTE